VEGFWSQMKRSIDGTHHHVSKQHLQKYADEYAFRFNRRRSEIPMFSHLVSQLAEKPV
jgi:transposase